MAQGKHHIIPVRTLATVFGLLVVLTIITVVTAQFDLGAFNVPLALAIAGAKALVVAAVFMALKYDNPINFVVMSLGVIFAVVFLTITLTDTAFRGALGIQERGYIPFDVARLPHDASEQAHAAPEAPHAEVPATTTQETGVEEVPPPVSGEPDAAGAPAGANPTARTGAELYTKYCVTCHSLDGTRLAGPTFQGLGQVRTRDEIMQSIREPDAELVEGYPGLVMMATLNAFKFYEEVSDEELELLTAYILAQ